MADGHQGEHMSAYSEGTDDDLFRQFADGIPALAWIANADGYITFYNRRWHEYCGTTPAQMEGWGWQMVHDPAALPAVLEGWTASIASGEPFQMTFPLRGADGVFRPFLTRAMPQRGASGEVLRWFGTNTDVSQQVEAETALRLARTQAEARARETDAILRQLAEGVIVTDATGQITFVNQAAAALHGVAKLGVSPAEYTATYHLLTEAGDPYPMAELPLLRAVAGETVGDTRWRIARGDGTTVLAIGGARPLRDPDGHQTGAVLTVRDDTARDAVERDLHRTAALLRDMNATLEQRVADALAERKLLADVVESTDAFIAVLALDFTILAINRSNADEFERIYGVRPAAGDNMLGLLDGQPEHQAQVRESWGRALSGEEYSVEAEYGNAEHARAVYAIKFNALRDAQGTLIGAFNFVTDVTEQRQGEHRLRDAEERIRQAQKIEAIGQLTGGVAHDFNNILMVLSGGLEMIERHADAARRARVLAAMQQAVERGSTLSRQLLAFSRRQPLRPQTIDLARQIGAMRELLDGSLRGDVQVDTRFPDGLWPVAVDPGELELVILNLAVNARDAMAQGGTIVIAAENLPGFDDPDLRGDVVRLSVVDEGAGMAPDVLARVFEPFFTTKDVGKGSGLGLAQAHGFAQASGGVIRATSTPGVGTTVSLLLPRSRDAAVAHPLDNGVKPPHDGSTDLKILVVEDDDDVAALMTDMLEQLGHRVMRVASAAAALGALADGRVVDLVVSDVLMPGGMDGIALAREIAVRRADLPVVLTSGYSGAAGIAAERDGIDILAKPFNLDGLAGAIELARVRAAAG